MFLIAYGTQVGNSLAKPNLIGAVVMKAAVFFVAVAAFSSNAMAEPYRLADAQLGAVAGGAGAFNTGTDNRGAFNTGTGNRGAFNGGSDNRGAFNGNQNADATSGNDNRGAFNGNFNGGSYDGNGNRGAFNGNFNGNLNR